MYCVSGYMLCEYDEMCIHTKIHNSTHICFPKMPVVCLRIICFSLQYKGKYIFEELHFVMAYLYFM